MKRSPDASKLSAEAYQSVREEIRSGRLRLGEAISRRKVAAELGMSFLPVSEALLRLELEGLLESRPRAGTRVRIPSREDVQGHYTVREALETQAARLFAQLASENERTELKKLAARVDSLAKREDRLRYLELHERLHKRIADGAQCPALSRALEQTHSLSSTWLCLPSGPLLEDLDRPHRDLADGLCNINPDVAAEAMRRHVQTSLQRSLIRLSAYFQIRADTGKRFARKRKEELPPPSD